jgi:preprotein translocase subunit SecG
MISILIGIATFVLLIVCVFLVLIVLMQKTKDGGMGSALGGGVTESTFGAETGNVLTKTTIKLAITFFVLTFVLYLGQIYVRKHAAPVENKLPTIDAPAAPSTETPAAGAPADASTPAAPAEVKVSVPTTETKTP